MSRIVKVWYLVISFQNGRLVVETQVGARNDFKLSQDKVWEGRVLAIVCILKETPSKMGTRKPYLPTRNSKW